MSPQRIILLGGPNSGKTTYLSALLDALDVGQLSGLERVRLPDDARALERWTEPLLEGRYPSRTLLEQRDALELDLRHRPVDAAPFDFSIHLSDYAGEEVERLFHDRIDGWSPEWQLSAKATTLLLVLRPDAIIPLPLLGGRAVIVPPRRVRPAPFGSEPTSVFGAGVVRDELPSRRLVAPTQPIRIPLPTVLAVLELLQFIRHGRGLDPGERPPPGSLRVGVLMSAWDAVDDATRQQGPAIFLSEHMPLLVDFLWSNFTASDTMCFGLSATGGDLWDDHYRETYMENPGGFVEWADVTGKIQRSLDLGIPLRWALFGDTAMQHDV